MLSDADSPGHVISPRLDDGLLATYYQEFRRLARRALRGSDGRITLQPTDLAHEAALRLIGAGSLPIRDEAHFLALGARVIRTTLVDEIRRRRAAKRDVAMVTRWDERHEAPMHVDVEDFDRLLEKLAVIDAGAAAVVELRFYVGLTMTEIAGELDLSESTALRRWRLARAWLLKELALTG